jgi:hypothetical protein
VSECVPARCSTLMLGILDEVATLPLSTFSHDKPPSSRRIDVKPGDDEYNVLSPNESERFYMRE